MSDSLVTYLTDHLGGAQVAIELLEAMCEKHDDEKFREFAEALLPEIHADDQILQSIAEKVGKDSSVVKKAGGWLVEKFARLKLGHTGSTDFELFESLELLAVGIQGKLCLWKALQAASGSEARLREYDFAELVRRAEQQYANVESQRLNLAQTVL